MQGGRTVAPECKASVKGLKISYAKYPMEPVLCLKQANFPFATRKIGQINKDVQSQGGGW